MNDQSTIGKALVAFTTLGVFPAADVASLKLSPSELPPAIEALAQAKSNLKVEIHNINEETAPDVAAWKTNASSLQVDVQRSHQLVNDILRQASEPVILGEEVEDAATKVSFLQAELAYNTRVREALDAIKAVRGTLDDAKKACAERRISDALVILEKVWEAIDAIPVGKGIRVVRLLDVRARELRNTVHEVFEHVWGALVLVDVQGRKVEVSRTKEGEAMSLADAVVGLKTYKEMEHRMARFCHEVKQAVVGPRMDPEASTLPAVVVDGGALCVKGEASRSIDALFSDLNKVFSYFAETLPPDLMDSVSALMMPEVTSRIISDWLDSAVPASLKEIDRFESITVTARQFCARLSELKFTGFAELHEWVEDAPKVWLAKCRETVLDTVRVRLSGGLGSSKQVERIEKQMVSLDEGKRLAHVPATVEASEEDDWGFAWNDGEEQQDERSRESIKEEPKSAETFEEDGADAWGWGDDSDAQEAAEPQHDEPGEDAQEDDDGGDDWGWGDEDTHAEPQSQWAHKVAAKTAAVEQREMTLKETYNISAMPEPVLQLVFAVVEDGAKLTSAEYERSLVATAAAGLFSLPTLALAMFRAVGPCYYSLNIGGNMFLYNDSTYLAEKLNDYATAWNQRTDLSPQALRLLRLENEVKILRSFAARAYSNEMNLQKTVLRDLLGGSQSLIQQDDIVNFVDAAVARVRSLAQAWEGILARSAWYQAVGSLVDAVSVKIIGDVMDAASISRDDAYIIAELIATVTKLDDLFLHKGKNVADKTPQTMSYAPSWMRLKYLSEVLQSNLHDVRFLWMESELSLFFSMEELVELINLSFDDNSRTREVIREITSNPHPRQEEA